MKKAEFPTAWWLGRSLMRKSLDLAFEDPEMAVRLANLGVRASAILGEEHDPFAEPAKPKRGRRRKASKEAR